MVTPFLDIPSRYEDADIVLLPVPFERTVTFGGGTAGGPSAFLKASAQVELYDDETGVEITDRVRIHTLDPIEVPRETTAREMAGRLTTVARDLLAEGKWILAVGGEHSITPGIFAAHAEVHPGLGILQIDAHADMREEYLGDPYSHASAMARIGRDIVKVGIGIRNYSREEAEIIEGGANYHVFPPFPESPLERMDEVLSLLPEKVYLSIDLDGLDPSVIPGTGTPEPGGLSWFETISILRRIAAEREIVGADIVELSPIEGTRVSEFAAARLAHKLLTYIVMNKG